MGIEIDLLEKYPKAKRDLTKRAEEKTEEDRRIARQFGREFFDGDRKTGYGGYNYHPRFWQEVVKDMRGRYGLTSLSRVLDIGCGKGFMLYDLKELIPGITVAGVDISEYAIANCKEEMRPYLQVANATSLPFPDKSFDLVISITTLHNLEGEDIKKAFREIVRVTKKDAFITVDAYRDEEERVRMAAWNLTALTVKHVDDWKKFFAEVGYTGDYYWFIP